MSVQRGRVPIVVGGTGLYLRWLIQGRPTTPKSDAASAEKAQAALHQVRHVMFVATSATNFLHVQAGSLSPTRLACCFVFRACQYGQCEAIVLYAWDYNVIVQPRYVHLQQAFCASAHPDLRRIPASACRKEKSTL